MSISRKSYYDNNDTLSFEDVNANLLSKGKFVHEIRSTEKVQGLSMRGRTFGKKGTNKRNSRSKSRGCKFKKFAIIVGKQGI